MGFVGANLNPDPSGGYWDGPPLPDRYWYPLYEALCELDVPAMVHVSAACNPHFHTTGSHYLGADTTAFMQLLTSDLFADFPDLRLVIPHGGGAVPYHWGRFRGLAQDMGRPPLDELLLGNVFFDTCVYHQAGIDCLLAVIPADNVLFASEMVGAVRGIDPETGHHYDDTRRYLDAAGLSDEDRTKIFETNARRVFPRLEAEVSRSPCTPMTARHVVVRTHRPGRPGRRRRPGRARHRHRARGHRAAGLRRPAPPPDPAGHPAGRAGRHRVVPPGRQPDDPRRGRGVPRRATCWW